MLDDSQRSTLSALNELVELRSNSPKPLVFWIGAGASRWAGLPGWSELADSMFREFGRKEPLFDKQRAEDLLEKKAFPTFFGLCKSTDPSRYHSCIIEQLKSRQESHPVYDRFISAIKNCIPCRIVTTNVDELLEQHLSLAVVLPSSVERVPLLLNEEEDFLAKIHGSISDVKSLIFTDGDYSNLVSSTFCNALMAILQNSHVVFVGYGLADEYVINMIRQSVDDNQLFGTGPHFACLSTPQTSLPHCVKSIHYLAEPHRDHRGVIEVVEEVAMVVPIKSAGRDFLDKGNASKGDLISAHFLADVYPPGTWSSSQRCSLVSEDGRNDIVMYSGHGLINSELPHSLSTATHDLLIGLLCFDQVFASSQTISRVLQLLGMPLATDLISAGLIRFVRLDDQDVVLFPGNKPEILGELAVGVMGAGKPLSTNELLRRQLKPIPGMESDGYKLIDRVSNLVDDKMIEVDNSEKVNIAAQARSLLIRPSIRKMLGMSGGVPATVIPGWLKFPVLRLAHVVRLGFVCRNLKVSSAKLDFGYDVLAGVVFGGAFGIESAEKLASYVVAGNFSTNLGEYVNTRPEVIAEVLRFRDKPEGQQLRFHIQQCLAISEGGEVATSINTGLKQIIPLSVLEAARSSFANLRVPPSDSKLPALWHDPGIAGAALHRWRGRSAIEFVSICKSLRIGYCDPCPCGSGERVRRCCAEELNVKPF